MRLKIFSIVFLLAITLFANDSFAQKQRFRESLPKDTSQLTSIKKLDKRVHIGYTGVNKIIPTHTKVHFAGGMGLVSTGLGWDYGKRAQWETDFFFGFIPKYSGGRGYLTLTLKENYIPWSIDLGKEISFEPLNCGVYVNSVLSRDFWVTEPDRYPRGYYGFSVRLRPYIFFGERFTFNIGHRNWYDIKAITFYYDVCSPDIYFISSATNRYIKFWDCFSLAFGVKLQLL